MVLDELNVTVEIFHQCRATLDPVPAVQVAHAAKVADFGLVDVAANDPIDRMASGKCLHGLLEMGHVLDR